ncbi:MAG: hypothetical protein IPL52_00500 [Flavobacteriales bacterium]|nr:hypothetical protein [Flavobacteriales bacterium]
MRNLLLTTALGMAVVANAQISFGGEPAAWAEEAYDRSAIPVFDFGPLGDEELAPTTGDFRYGVQRFGEVDVLREGAWLPYAEDSYVCRMVLRSPGAIMISVQFDRWELNEGDRVYLFNTDRTHYLGAYDASNRMEDGTMATAVLPGDEMVIEYHASGIHRTPAQLRVSSITHAWIDLFGFADADDARDYDPGYQSAACHINIICPEAAAWQAEKRSVAMFLRPDGNGCTGNLLNNTQSPRKPYFHLANHCYTTTTSQWVFYFNYESPTCVGSTGPTTQTITGATLRANYYYTDMCLLELSSTPPANYNIYYAGWDRSGTTPQEGTVIEHPLYDVKKYAHNNDPLTTFTDAIGIPSWRGNWEQGLVQAVSSGSPLFDQNHRMVGHMYDGAQVCTTATSIPTDCAKFSAGWDGTAASTRMRDWLNPANNLTTLDGFDAAASPSVALRVRMYLEGPYNTGTQQMNSTLRANGLVPLAEPYASLGYAHVGGGGETTTNAVLSVTGANAVVDWVVVELRSNANSAQIMATRSALLQADGDVVAASDGTSALSFNVANGSYFVALRHRNHLGIMTAGTASLSSTVQTIDFSNGTVPLYGGANATTVVGTRNALFAGDVDRNGVLVYVGASNDRDPILARIGGTVPTGSVTGYYAEDVNMDGQVLYTGTNNDRDPILVNIGGSLPTATRSAQLP